MLSSQEFGCAATNSMQGWSKLCTHSQFFIVAGSSLWLVLSPVLYLTLAYKSTAVCLHRHEYIRVWFLAAANDTVQIGIATFDTTVHFYSLQASQSQAQMLVMPDVDEVYSVSSASVVVSLQHSHHLVSY